ncbi:tumor necrosis factor receptor superfamily member 14-like isoform X2 [Colossoma macropomum]|uniref:tumor necrosis factor receptor superfamily member 14-like isoform X2 n=1 Tax=Colossoma macropomum TaxID=42526 RepID=UPI0018653114|nr:tumor necrosis factor receptor superfamily member 14-like isoform X2 [Colossoma macropomum]
MKINLILGALLILIERGTYVYKSCTNDMSTICIQCTVCDPAQGLRVKTACTWSSDTVCEPIDGYYCTDQQRGSCIQAVEHTNCSPGQYIKHIGTAFKNTECAECLDGTYSDGSLQVCQPQEYEDLGFTPIVLLIVGLVVVAAVAVYFKMAYKSVQRHEENSYIDC